MVELTAPQKSLIGYMAKGFKYSAHGFGLILKSDDPAKFFPDLRSAGMFDPAHNPSAQEVEGKQGLFHVPVWPVLDYLSRLASIAGDSNDAELGAKLIEIVRSVSKGDDIRGAVDNYHTNATLAEIIRKVPTPCVALEVVDLAKGWLATRWGNSTIVPELDKAIHRFLEGDAAADHAKAVRLLHHCTELQGVESANHSSGDRQSVADTYWLGELLEHNAQELGKVAKAEAMDCLLGRLRQLFEGEFISKSSWLHRPAIEAHEQNHDWDDVTNAFVDATREALDAWLKVDPVLAKAYVMQMLADEAQIIRRVAINAVRNNWSIVGVEFEATISPALFEVGHLHELYWLLRDHYTDFSDPAKVQVMAAITSIADGHDLGSREIEIAKRRQQDWLHAIAGIGDAQADAAYERISGVVDATRDHPDFLAYHESWVGGGTSPYTPEEITTFAEDRSLIRRIDAFVPPRDERMGSRKSLIDALSAAVAAAPHQFLWMLTTSESMSRRIQYGLINGFKTFIEKSEAEPATDLSRIGPLLEPFISYFDQVLDFEFWVEQAAQSDDFEPNKDWIPPVIAGLAKKLVANDAMPLSPADMEHLVRIIATIMEHSPGVDMSDDPMTAAINNARGMAVEALLQAILRRCRDADKSENNHEAIWRVMQSQLDAELAGCTSGRHLETSTLLGCYLAQMHYVDEAWVSGNMDRIFPFSHHDNLLCALAGLSFANSSPRVYQLLKDGDIPWKALRLDSLKGSARERLIERLAIAYLWGQEELESPCIRELFTEDHLDDLTKLVTTTVRWSKSKLKSEQVQRIKDLARKSVMFGADEPKSRQRLLAAASRFISFLDMPNEEDMVWLVPVARYAHQSHWGSDFVEALARIAAKDAKQAKVLLEAFLENYQFSHDYRERLKSVVQAIYAAGLRVDAMKAVNFIIEKGGGADWTTLYGEMVDGQ
jgi:hypothetical protein